MQNIAIYLEKFKTLGLKERESKDLVIDVVKNICGFTLSPKQIVSKDGEITCNVTGSQKAVLFLYKSKVIEEIKKMLDDPKEFQKIS